MDGPGAGDAPEGGPLQPAVQRKQAGSGGLSGGARHDAAEGEEPPPGPILETLMDVLRDRWYLVVGAAVGLFVLIFILKDLGGGAGSTATDGGTPREGERPAASQSAAPRQQDSAITFEAPVESEGIYYLKAGGSPGRGSGKRPRGARRSPSRVRRPRSSRAPWPCRGAL